MKHRAFSTGARGARNSTQQLQQCSKSGRMPLSYKRDCRVRLFSTWRCNIVFATAPAPRVAVKAGDAGWSRNLQCRLHVTRCSQCRGACALATPHRPSNGTEFLAWKSSSLQTLTDSAPNSGSGELRRILDCLPSNPLSDPVNRAIGCPAPAAVCGRKKYPCPAPVSLCHNQL
jgi:hypothetical protein